MSLHSSSASADFWCWNSGTESACYGGEDNLYFCVTTAPENNNVCRYRRTAWCFEEGRCFETQIQCTRRRNSVYAYPRSRVCTISRY